MKHLICLIPLLTSCGPGYVRSCDFFTAGLCVNSTRIVSPAEIETTVKAVEQFTQEYYPEVTNLIDTLEEEEVTLFLTHKTLVSNCTMIGKDTYVCNNLSGVNIGGGISIYIEYYEGQCLATTALAHEILHSVEYFYLGGIQGDHETPHMFVEWGEDITATIEFKIWDHLRKTLPSCESKE